MSFRIRSTLRTGARQLSTAARTVRAPRTGVYAVGTVLVGTGLAIAFELPKFRENFLLKAEELNVAEKLVRDEKEGSRCQFSFGVEEMELMGSGSRYFDITSCQAAFDFDYYALDPRWIGS
jgi:hypothetical protein